MRTPSRSGPPLPSAAASRSRALRAHWRWRCSPFRSCSEIPTRRRGRRRLPPPRAADDAPAPPPPPAPPAPPPAAPPPSDRRSVGRARRGRPRRVEGAARAAADENIVEHLGDLAGLAVIDPIDVHAGATGVGGVEALDPGLRRSQQVRLLGDDENGVHARHHLELDVALAQAAIAGIEDLLDLGDDRLRTAVLDREDADRLPAHPVDVEARARSPWCCGAPDRCPGSAGGCGRDRRAPCRA